MEEVGGGKGKDVGTWQQLAGAEGGMQEGAAS